MKTLTFKMWVMLLCVASMTMFTACETETGTEPENPLEYELRVLTFEDEDARFGSYALDYASATIAKWSDLIDNAQYNGTLTYTADGVYTWHDEHNTELTHRFIAPYWGGGHAVSNYAIGNYQTLPDGHSGWYELQFCTPLGGNNGSKNFCIHYSSGTSEQSFSFADNVERIIDYMYVTNTNYFLNSLTYGDGFNPTATENTYVKIVATGYNAKGEITGAEEFYLCRNGKCITTWEKFDLTSLGKVAKVGFSFSVSDDLVSEWGLSCPTYFAYDDVAVRFEK